MVPIIMALGSCDFAYVRVHRRVGKHRILSEEEIKRSEQLELLFLNVFLGHATYRRLRVDNRL